jgi:predicted transcriptional regulator
MDSLLMSFKPKYAGLILSGAKRYEYRRRLAAGRVGRIVIYAGRPVCRVLGEVEVTGTLTAPPLELWGRTRLGGGLDLPDFMDYFDGSRLAHAYCLGEAAIYGPPKALSDFGLERPPRSFVRLPGMTGKGEENDACA